MAESIRINNVIICYPHLFEKHAPPGTAQERYGAEFLLDPVRNAADCKLIEEAFRRVAIAAGKQDSLQFLKSPLQDGDQLNAAALAKGKGMRPELQGMKVVRGNDKTYRPAVVNQRLQPLGEAQRDQIFGGCIVNAFVDIYWSPNATNPGVYVGLRGVQLVDNVNVTALGGGGLSAEQMFDTIEGAPAGLQDEGGAGPAPNPFA